MINNNIFIFPNYLHCKKTQLKMVVKIHRYDRNQN